MGSFAPCNVSSTISPPLVSDKRLNMYLRCCREAELRYLRGQGSCLRLEDRDLLVAGGPEGGAIHICNEARDLHQDTS